MLIELFISVLIGILAGTFTGLMPGIHINLIGAILVGLSATAFSWVSPVYLIIFIASMSIAHTFIDLFLQFFLAVLIQILSFQFFQGMNC